MSESISWLTSNFSGYDYYLGVDHNAVTDRRRKAIKELKSLLRERNIEQINRAIKDCSE